MTDVAIDPQEWHGSDVVDSNGEQLGSIDDIYVDASTNKALWLTLKMGTAVAVVPFAGAVTEGRVMKVSFAKDHIQAAPKEDEAALLCAEHEKGLYQHYGLAQAERGNGRDVSGPTTDNAMTRSEEELVVGTATVETGRARLRKWVETVPVTRTATVSHEELRVEREPITDANRDRAMSGPEISEEEHELVLHEERAVAQKEVVPKERVRLSAETVTSQTEIHDELRKERIEIDAEPQDEPTP
jgi:uncharacterized protein (TIGR02271 family)